MLPGLLLWFTFLPSGLEQLLVQAVLGNQSVMEAFGRIPSSTCPSSRYSHLEIWTSPSPSYLSVLRCLGVPSGVRRIFGTRALHGSTVDTCFTGGYWRTSHIFSVRGTQTRGVLSPLRRMEKCAQLMLRVAVFLRAVRTLNLDIISASSPWWRCWVFRRILRHFSRSSGCPGVERQFFELSSAHTCECSRLQWCRSRRESDSQVTRHQGLHN